MKFNKYVLATALFTGLLCGIWGGFSGNFGLLAWAGFAGCTAYFASGRSGVGGVLMSIVTTLIGVAYGWLMVVGAQQLGGSEIAFTISVGLLVACIVLMGQIKWTSFVPGIFVGCYSYFALADGNWQMLSISLVLGVILGFVCDIGGRKLFAKWQPKPVKTKRRAASRA